MFSHNFLQSLSPHRFVESRVQRAVRRNQGQKLDDKVSVSYSLDGFAALAVKKGNFDCTARLTGASEHLRESFGFVTEPAERRFRDAYLAELHSLLDERVFSEAYEQGRKMKIEKAVAMAITSEQQK